MEVKIGIIVAMSKELNLMLGMIEDVEKVNINGLDFYVGRDGENPIVVMQCGIGKVNAAIGTMSLIENFHPSLVINSGVAGGTGHAAKMGDIVIADRIAYHDVWCGPGTKWGRVADCPRYFSCPDEADRLSEIVGGKSGLVTSGDIFVSRAEDVKRILDLYPDAIAVDMESAAVAHTCYKRNTPMICVRIVSDTPGQADNEAQYENFWETAPEHTFNAVKQVMHNCEI